jgi:hypothetical protein
MLTDVIMAPSILRAVLDAVLKHIVTNIPLKCIHESTTTAAATTATITYCY